MKRRHSKRAVLCVPVVIKSKHLHHFAWKFCFIWSKIHENEVLYHKFIKTVSRRRPAFAKYWTFQLNNVQRGNCFILFARKASLDATKMEYLKT